MERGFREASERVNMLDKHKAECGIFGIFGHPEAGNMAYLGLYAVQHRGQESAGIVSSSGSSQLHSHKAMGLVADIFTEDVLRQLPGQAAIGHVRSEEHTPEIQA